MASPAEPVDFVKMFEEIKAIRAKYGMRKGTWFVPDKLEISVQRISYDNFHLSYKEFFNYLPNHILNIVLPSSINLLVQVGIPRERIKRIEDNGVGMELDANLLPIVSCILTELLIQKRLTDNEISSLFGAVQKIRKVFTDFSELEFEWNNEAKSRFYNSLGDLTRIIQEHPSALVEIEEIVKRYTQQSKIESEETEKL